MTTVKDSGTRREFGTGAHRDMAEGKGDMVSIPWESILRLSKHYEAGAKKYDRWNFRKGIPVSAFLDSACRHLAKYQSGCDDEDHLSAAAFNVLGAMLMENTKPEMVDLPMREGKATFPYFESESANPAPESPDTERLTAERDFWHKAYEDKKILNRIMGEALRFEQARSETEAATKATDAELRRAGERLAEITAPAPSPTPRPYKIIAVDFDGTLCVDAWPEIGQTNWMLIDSLKGRQAAGDKLILWTCREGEMCEKAVAWCNERGLRFDAVNANLPEMNALYGNDSRKIGADLYIDDKAQCVKA